MSDDRFDWNSEVSKADTIVPEQRSVAAYWNPNGDLVIRQKADGITTDEDPFIVVHETHMRALITKLEELAKEAGV